MLNNTAQKTRRAPGWLWPLLLFLLAEGGAVALAYYWRVFYYLDARGVSALAVTGGLCMAAAALYALAFAIVRFVRGFDARAVVCILLCGLLFVFVDPPFQPADETLHYLRSYSISQGYFDFDGARTYPESVARLYDAFPGAWVNAHTSAGYKAEIEKDGTETVKVYNSEGFALKQYGEGGRVESIADSFRRYFDADAEVKTVSEPISFVILPYLPAALGMALARLLGLAALGCLYGGRIANLAVYTLLCWLALKNCRRYKPAFLAVMLLPLSLSMAASLNYDAILLGCYWFAASYYCRDEITDRSLYGYFAVFWVMNAIKPWISLLWLALVLVLPKKAWKARMSKLQFAVVAVAGAVALSLAIVWYGNAFRTNYPAIGRMLGDEVVDGGAQLLFLLRNPLRFLAVLVGTLYENDLFLGQMGVFGALDLPISVLNVLSPCALLFGAALSVHERSSLRPLPAAGLGAFAVCYAGAVMSALYLTFTPVGMVRVLGLQARYFLPCFLLLAVLLAALLSHVLEPRESGEKPLHTALWTFGALGILGALLMLQHYFVGPVYTI